MSVRTTRKLCNILIVDWDFFFYNPNFGPPVKSWHLYDWSHKEAPFYMDAAWHTRSGPFYRSGLDLPGLTGEQKGFWERFRFSPGALLFYGRSNALAVKKIVSNTMKWDQLWLYDAHHDSGYFDLSSDKCHIETEPPKQSTVDERAHEHAGTSLASEHGRSARTAASNLSTGTHPSTSSTPSDASPLWPDAEQVSERSTQRSPNVTPSVAPAICRRTGESSNSTNGSPARLVVPSSPSLARDADGLTSRYVADSAIVAVSARRREIARQIVTDGFYSCDNWMVLYEALRAELHMRYPSWKTWAIDIEPTPLVDVDRAWDGASEGPHVTFDRVFVCRSDAWVPPWKGMDAAFQQFVDSAPVKATICVEGKLGDPLPIREWDERQHIEAAREEARVFDLGSEEELAQLEPHFDKLLAGVGRLP